MSGAGDVDGDGRDDVIVGDSLSLAEISGSVATPNSSVPPPQIPPGSAFVYSGADGSLIWRFDGPLAPVTPPGFGFSVSTAGDVNGDGRADILVGAPNTEVAGIILVGSAFVYSGADGTPIGPPFDGSTRNGRFGSSVSDAGDVDGDGRDDIIVGAPQTDIAGIDGAGSVFVYSGADRSLIWRFNGQAQSEQLGGSVSGAGDLNGDNRADIIVGSVGSVFVYSGADGSLIWRFDEPVAGRFFGQQSVSTAGDVNGDGTPDIIVGARGSHPGGVVAAGSVYVYSGADGSLLYRLDGPEARGEAGASVDTAGDVNGDGRSELIVGAPRTDPNGINRAGSAFVWAVNPPLPVVFVPGIAGSLLVDRNNNDEVLWVGPSTLLLRKMSLFPRDRPDLRDVLAPDVLRFEAGDIYGSFLLMLADNGYHEYDVNDASGRFDPSRRSLAGCDTSQADDDSAPNLFVFAYDWRQDNAANAVLLHEYIQCVRQFHPDSDINILTHSMGAFSPGGTSWTTRPTTTPAR